MEIIIYIKSNKLLILLLLYLSIKSESSGQELLEKICYNSLALDDPHCYHGGTLHGTNSSDYQNCAYCDCPEEWKGSECSLCTSREYCPINADGKDAIACSYDKIFPTSYEKVYGKKLSCKCGGFDATTQYTCDLQPSTLWEIEILPIINNNTESEYFDMLVLERAGMPSQDYAPEGCTQERYKYSYAQVWEGKFNNCTVNVGECISPLTGDDCIVYNCIDSIIECPPSYVEKCPGWTEFSCDIVEDERLDYWQHHCNPISYPLPHIPVIVSCKNYTTDGYFQCYMAQPEVSIIASLGMQCMTGTCEYLDDQVMETIGIYEMPEEEGKFKEWIEDNSEAITIGMLWILLILILMLFMILTLKDKRKSMKRAGSAAGSFETNGIETEKAVETPLIARLNDYETLFSYDYTEHPCYFTFKDIQYYVKTSNGKIKHILKGIDGVAARNTEFHAGNMLAVLGPSGAGKTSLLNILSGFKSVGVSGKIWINGNEMKAGDTHIRRISGYVHQDDILPGTSTVFEYLIFNASLRMSSRTSHEELECRVYSIIRKLGLDKVSHHFIGDQFTRGLSGGEKRRVSIACELLTGPGLIFLDEPTTGLDSTNAKKIVDILSNMASSGVTVIMTIHQPRPDLFRMLDRVLLLSATGQMIYSGPSASDTAETYFKSIGYVSEVYIMDYMLDVIVRSSQDVIDDLSIKYKQSDVRQKENEIIQLSSQDMLPFPIKKYKASFIRQMKCLSTRLLRNCTRHPLLIAMTFASTIIISLLLGLFFKDTGVNTDGIQSRLGVLFFIIIFLSLLSISSLPIWREERVLFERERGNGLYDVSAYFLSILIFDLIPLRVLPPLFFTLFSYWLIGLHPDCYTCIIWFSFILILTNVVATLLSMMIGAASPSNEIANALGSFFILIFLLFGGFFLNKEAIPWYCQWLSAISYFNYGYEALVINEFLHFPTDLIFSAQISSEEFPPLRVTGNTILCEFGFDKNDFKFDVLALCQMGLIFIIVTYAILFLSGRDNSKKIKKSDMNNELSSKIEILDTSLSQDSIITKNEANSSNSSSEPITITWTNISCKLWITLLYKKEQSILNNISGNAGPLVDISENNKSCLFAIMGPSGSGKTTLVDILAGRKRGLGITGDIKIQGKSVSAAIIRKMSGYVLQEDVLPSTSTVYEYIMFHAKLRLQGINYRELDKKVRSVCNKLDLNKVINSRIGDNIVRGLSGGEKRRVSIACELLVGKGLMFLDEPTTGLDTTNATKVVDILSHMSQMGITVIMTIHQPRPSFFKLMDKLLILSSNGQMIYSGTSDQIDNYFNTLGYQIQQQHVSMADYILDLAIKLSFDDVQRLVDAFSSSNNITNIDNQNIINNNNIEIELENNILFKDMKYLSSHLKQLQVLSIRMSYNLIRHPLILFVNFIAAILVSLLLGAVYWDTGYDTAGIQNRMGALFFISTYFSLMSLSSLPLWHTDRLLFARERASGAYGTTSYFIAVLLFDIVLMRILPPFLFVSFSYWMIGLHTSFVNILKFLIILILSNVTASTLSLAIGAAVPSPALANMFGSLTILMATLLGGFFLSRLQMSQGLSTFIDSLSKLSYVRYVFEALLANEFANVNGFLLTVSYSCVDSLQLESDSSSSEIASVEITGNELLRTFGFPDDPNHFYIDVLALLCFIFVHLTLIFLLFKLRGRPDGISGMTVIRRCFIKKENNNVLK